MPLEFFVTKPRRELPFTNHLVDKCIAACSHVNVPKGAILPPKESLHRNEYSSELGEQHLSEGRQQTHFLAVDQIVELHCQHT